MLRSGKARIFRHFRRKESGLAAVEFALILPVLITMLFGMAELSLAMFARTDITQIASTVSDLVAQESTVSATDFQNVYNAANIILYPYYKGSGNAADKPSIRITSLIFDTTTNSTTTGKVAWSCAQSGNLAFTLAPQTTTARVTNSTYTLDKPLLSTGSSVLMVEVAYKYTSPTSQALNASYKYYDKFLTKPRSVAQIPPPAACS